MSLNGGLELIKRKHDLLGLVEWELESIFECTSLNIARTKDFYECINQIEALDSAIRLTELVSSLTPQPLGTVSVKYINDLGKVIADSLGIHGIEMNHFDLLLGPEKMRVVMLQTIELLYISAELQYNYEHPNPKRTLSKVDEENKAATLSLLTYKRKYEDEEEFHFFEEYLSHYYGIRAEKYKLFRK
jgi:hypothetical protein